MSNWNGTARSNYFKVKNAAAFEAWLERCGLQTLRSTDHPDKVAITPDDGSDHGGWPYFRLDEIGGDDDNFDLAAELAPHLVDGEIAVLMECGAEKLRYLTGNAVAIHPDGRTVVVSLGDIYLLATQTFGHAPTEATY